MKAALFTILLITLIGCQRKEITTPGEIKTTSERPIAKTFTKARIDPDRISDLLETQVEEEVVMKQSSSDIMLIAHGRFAFIEHAEKEPTDPELLEGKVNKYEGASSIFYSFEIDEEAIKEKYAHLIGKEVKINNYDRDRKKAKIIDVVLVEDMWNEVPYYAAVLDNPVENDIYYAWTSPLGLSAYPFRDLGKQEVYEDEDIKSLNMFKRTTDFKAFEGLEIWDDDDVYPELVVHTYEHYKGLKYVVCQFNSVGVCGGMVDNLTGVYVERNGKTEQIGMGSIPYYVQDLIDIDGDGFPEILGAEFAASAIYSIRDGGLVLQQELSWSTMGCPC